MRSFPVQQNADRQRADFSLEQYTGGEKGWSNAARKITAPLSNIERVGQ